MARLAGKFAVVTGGSRGIGLAIAHTMIREGANVTIASRKVPGLEAAMAQILEAQPDAKGRIHFEACNTGDPDSVAALMAAAAERGPVDIVVNNAATNPYFGPMLNIEGRAWDKTFAVNTRGYFEVARHAAKAMVASGRKGSIINIASMLGMRAAPFQGVYGMTKAAVISMTWTLAAELGGAGIRVNAIAPGLVETKFASALMTNDKILAQYNAHTCLKRHAQPEEIAGAAVFLASEESSYMTGQVMPVDGGYTAM